MATVFYLPSSGAAAISPSSHSSWDADGSGFSRKAAVKTRGTTAMTSVSQGSSSSASIQISGYQWVYGPIASQTISGDVTARVRGRADTFINLFNARVAIWIAKSDATLRATLYAASSAFNATDWSTSFANYSATVTLTSGSASNGDYLVMEVGSNRNAFTDVDTSRVEIGDTNASNYMYFDFDATITDYVAPPTTLTYTNSGQTITAGNAMTNMVPSSGGDPVTSYVIQTGALPTGVSIHATTGVISGTPTVAGSYTWTVRASNAGGSDDSDSLTMTVNAKGTGWTFDIRLR